MPSSPLVKLRIKFDGYYLHEIYRDRVFGTCRTPPAHVDGRIGQLDLRLAYSLFAIAQGSCATFECIARSAPLSIITSYVPLHLGLLLAPLSGEIRETARDGYYSNMFVEPFLFHSDMVYYTIEKTKKGSYR